MTAAWALAPLDRIAATPGVAAFADRVAEIGWVLDHENDIDADFLAIYGIDLEVCDMTGPRYLALAHRLTAYQGVMAARLEEAREDTPQPPTAAPATTGPARQADGSSEVSLTAFRVQFPGLVSVARTAEDG